MHLFPIFLKKSNKKVLVLGNSYLLQSTLNLLTKAQISIKLVSPSITDIMQNHIVDHDIEYFQEDLTIERLDFLCQDVQIVISDYQLSDFMLKEIKKKNILINIIDNEQLSDFIIPLIVDRYPLIAAVSSGDIFPMLAKMVKSQIEHLLPNKLGNFAFFLHSWCVRTREFIKNIHQRRFFWEKIIDGEVAEHFYHGDIKQAEHKIESELYNSDLDDEKGIVYMIGAGPGNPDLLTLEALRLLQKSDITLYDRLVSKAVLDKTRTDAEKIYVGKKPGGHFMSQEQINKLLIKHAKTGKVVARLKGGDPSIFAQCSEEIQELRKEAIPFYITPGITSATAAAAYAKIPLTCRNFSSHCTFITGHNRIDQLPWQDFVFPNQTLVFYMGITNIELIVKQLIVHGLSEHTPAAIIQKVGYVDQKLVVTTINELAYEIKQKKINPPSMIIIGTVVTYAKIQD